MLLKSAILQIISNCHQSHTLPLVFHSFITFYLAFLDCIPESEAAISSHYKLHADKQQIGEVKGAMDN